MHPLLARQLKRLGIDPVDESVPVELSEALLKRVDKTYGEADQDRYTLERSLTISSREMSELHQGLRTVQSQLASANEDLRRALALAQARQEQLRTLAQELDRRVTEGTRELAAAQALLVSSERLAAVGQLAAGVANEVNNPLAYVNANIIFALNELSRSGTPSQGTLSDVIEALTQARDGASRICRTTKYLNVFSRGDGERRDPIDLRRTLESCINMARSEIRHRARLVEDFGPTQPILADEGRLAQVFLNLLLNAAQAVPDGDAETNEIRVVTRETNGCATVEISDTGTGIAPEHLGRLFEPFFTTKPIGVGTGLGLSICHGIVRSLGGTIEVQSKQGVGSLFRVTIPIGGLVADTTNNTKAGEASRSG